uniref:C2H2-type domain-containing protein n=1 Tax=Glossina austeni TaxID=7395 RepID=A0A1A9VWR8_GLOAU
MVNLRNKDMCGVVFINEKHFLVFHCTHCEKVFDVFGMLLLYFFTHYSLVNHKRSEDDTNKIVSNDEMKTLEFNDLDCNYEKVSIESIQEEEIFLPEEAECEPTTESDTKLNEAAESNNEENEKLYPRAKYRRIYTQAVRRHKCHLCGFAFKDSSNLANHLRRHTGQKDYPCTVCPKKFFTRTELEAHERRHNGERPFLCTHCGKGFATSGSLLEHTKRHTNYRAFKCDECGKSFYNGCQLREHQAMHSDERAVICTRCPATFKTKKRLRAHMKIHLNLREHRCNICGAAFNQSPGLASHMKTKHKIEKKSLI